MNWRQFSPAAWLAVYAGCAVLVAAGLVLTRASSAWMALLVAPVPLFVIWQPSRVYLPMTLLLGIVYQVVNLQNHPETLAATTRGSVSILVTLIVVSETLFRNGRARRRAEAALEAKNAELAAAVQRANDLAAAAQEASQIKSEFLANTSHELRTPLTAILSALDLVLAGFCDDPAEERRFVELAHASSHKLLNVINSVLDIAKIEAGKVDVEPVVMPVAPVIDEVYNLCRVPAADRGLRLTVEWPAGPVPAVVADGDKLRQILLNLVGNALKFTPQGEIRISAEPDPAAGVLRVRVQDTGIGIAPEKQGRLFQPFVQADSSVSRRFGGTGLGLSISRRLAELMGADLALYSAGEGLGSTFTLTLPAVREPA
ncbi:MAG: hypothetical protein JNK29_13355 [Anaerolineales bacterium]|nr:hypothetical protein [Anaerolineales bacterium]